ncbi:MAG: hypothetical protein JSS61_06270 [Verrucomicrobia bacterium]|nr:hypothetical protein [Verrucomicrobiota bacterium]
MAVISPFVIALEEMQARVRFHYEFPSQSSESTESTAYSFTPFADFYHSVKRLREAGTLCQVIAERREEIAEKNEHWRLFVEAATAEDPEFYCQVQQALNEGRLYLCDYGDGSAYWLIDKEGSPRFVIKPTDEEIFCLNNPKKSSSPYNDSKHRARDPIPLYRSAQTDCCAYEIALLCGLESITPKTRMGILQQPEFFDISQRYAEAPPPFSLEKLCTIQDFSPHECSLSRLRNSLYAKHLSPTEISALLDQEDFEKLSLFLWLTYDTDAHGSNFLVYKKDRDLYGIYKVDNSLSLPEYNADFYDVLTTLPNALFPLSPSLKERVRALPVDQILGALDRYELSACKEAILERIALIQTLVEVEGMTLGEVDLRLILLEVEEGLPLKEYTVDEIIDYFYPPSDDMTS